MKPRASPFTKEVLRAATVSIVSKALTAGLVALATLLGLLIWTGGSVPAWVLVAVLVLVVVFAFQANTYRLRADQYRSRQAALEAKGALLQFFVERVVPYFLELVKNLIVLCGPEQVEERARLESGVVQHACRANSDARVALYYVSNTGSFTLRAHCVCWNPPPVLAITSRPGKEIQRFVMDGETAHSRGGGDIGNERLERASFDPTGHPAFAAVPVVEKQDGGRRIGVLYADTSTELSGVAVFQLLVMAELLACAALSLPLESPGSSSCPCTDRPRGCQARHVTKCSGFVLCVNAR